MSLGLFQEALQILQQQPHAYLNPNPNASDNIISLMSILHLWKTSLTSSVVTYTYLKITLQHPNTTNWYAAPLHLRIKKNLPFCLSPLSPGICVPISHCIRHESWSLHFHVNKALTALPELSVPRGNHEVYLSTGLSRKVKLRLSKLK
jgi:hypothetical protein